MRCAPTFPSQPAPQTPKPLIEAVQRLSKPIKNSVFSVSFVVLCVKKIASQSPKLSIVAGWILFDVYFFEDLMVDEVAKIVCGGDWLLAATDEDAHLHIELHGTFGKVGAGDKQ
jgi:hypothetical protein